MLLRRKFLSQRKRSGYSRADMVLLMLIGGTVLSLLIIALSRVRRQHERMPHDASNLKSIALAYHSFNDEFKMLPPAFDSFEPMKFKLPTSVHVHLLPFLEWDPFYQFYQKNPDFFKPNPPPIMPYYVSNSDPSCQDLFGIQNFAANLRIFSRKGWNTKFDAEMPALARVEPGNASLSESFEDGLSNTILLATKFACCSQGGSQYLASPDSLFGAFFGQSPASQRAHPFELGVTFQLIPPPSKCRPNPLMAQSFMERGLLVALADGSARVISPNISPQVWNRLLQPNDGMGHIRDWGE